MRVATFNVQNLRLREIGGLPVLDGAGESLLKLWISLSFELIHNWRLNCIQGALGWKGFHNYSRVLVIRAGATRRAMTCMRC
jgi:hypothetical protein